MTYTLLLSDTESNNSFDMYRCYIYVLEFLLTEQLTFVFELVRGRVGVYYNVQQIYAFC